MYENNVIWKFTRLAELTITNKKKSHIFKSNLILRKRFDKIIHDISEIKPN